MTMMMMTMMMTMMMMVMMMIDDGTVADNTIDAAQAETVPA